MAKIMLDLTELESKTAIEYAARSFLLKELGAFLESKYEGVRRCGATEFNFPIGIATNEGFTVDVSAIVSVKVPKFYTIVHKDKSKKDTPAYNVVRATWEWESDPKTIRKIKREEEGIAYAQEHIIEAEPFEYDFNELEEEDT